MITGASGGLGKGIAEAALRRGDAVALTSRSPEKLNAMVAEFPKQAMGVKLITTKNDKIIMNKSKCQTGWSGIFFVFLQTIVIKFNFKK